MKFAHIAEMLLKLQMLLTLFIQLQISLKCMQKIQIHIPNVSNKEIMDKGDTKINPMGLW